MGDRKPEEPGGKDNLLTGPPFYLPEFERSYRYIIDEYDVAPKEIAIFMPVRYENRTAPAPATS